jgi:2'-5' RNA ligase
VDNKQRIFIGIPIGKSAQRAIDQLLVPLKPHSRSLRWVPAGNRHLTLAFLGDISLSNAELLRGNFTETYRRYIRFHYGLSALERFPNARGMIIALTGEASEPLHSLAMTTRDMVRMCGLDFERKKFRPHVTLARIRNPKHPLAGLDRQVQVDTDVNRVVLYRSTLTESGSIYTELTAAELG